MERLCKEIKLPVTGYKVQVYNYYLRGDRVAIEKIMTDAVEMTGEGNISKVDTGYKYDMEDEAVMRAIKSIKEGEKVFEVNIDTIHSLPEEDYQFITDNLPKQDRKKSTTKPSEGISEKPQKNGE